jgi:hypothetical protein
MFEDDIMDQLISQFSDLNAKVNWSKVINHEVKLVFANLTETTNKYSEDKVCFTTDFIYFV